MLTLLLVDAQAERAKRTQQICAEHGYRVVWADCVASALNEADAGFDLAILHNPVGQTSAVSLLSDLKRGNSDAELLVIIEAADLQTALDALKNGAFSYLTLPFGPDQLLLTLSRARERVELKRKSRALSSMLERSERRMRQILGQVDALIVSVDGHLSLRYANQAAQAFLGMDAETLLGRTAPDLLSLPPYRKQLEEQIRSNESIQHPAIEVRRVDGATRWLSWRWTSGLEQDQGELWYGVATDVTEAREKERAQRTAERRANLESLLQALNHVLRNWLNSASLNLTVLSRQLADVPQNHRSGPEDSASIIRKELTGLDELLKDFATVARPRDYSRSRVEIGSLIDDVCVRIEDEHPGTSVKLAIDGLLMAHSHPSALAQVVQNVLTNSAQAEAKEILVSATEHPDHISVRILDNGRGLSPDTESKIYDAFFTTTPNNTGLGLTIVKTLCAELEIDFELKNAPQQGCIAELTIPKGPKEPG